MSTSPKCPKCNERVNARTLGGLCPSCVRKQALLASDDFSIDDEDTEITDATNPRTMSGLGSSFGDYLLVATIARGGMGVVYRARQRSLNREVALKMVLSGQFAGADELRRFKAEAEAAARLDHPHIVPIYEVGEHEGRAWFSMRLIEGGTLAQKMNDTHGGKLPPREAAALMVKIARAVHYAHQRGLIHRDLKPANILLDAQGEPHITDFGLAKEIESEGHTMTGAVLGTPGYMAPEQAAGKVNELTTAVDVFALGAILYHLLAGRPPFEGKSSVEVITKVIKCEPARPTTVGARIDRDLETIVLRCLEKEPSARFGSTESLADDLDRWLRGETILARRSTMIERTVKWARRRPAVALLTLLSFLSLGAAVVTLGWGFERARADAIRIGRAQMETQGQLRNALFSQARSRRLSRIAGWRSQGLGDLRKAAATEAGVDVRDEAIAHLAGMDLEIDGETRFGWLVRPSPDFELFAKLSKGEIEFYDKQGGLTGPKVSLGGKPFDWLYQNVVFARDGRHLAVVHPSLAVALVDVVNRKLIKSWRERAQFCGFDGESSKALIKDFDHWAFVRLADGKVEHTIPIPERGRGAGWEGHLAQDSIVLPNLERHSVSILDWRSGREQAAFEAIPQASFFTWEGERLVVANRGSDQRVTILNLRNGQRQVVELEGRMREMALSRDGRWLSVVLHQGFSSIIDCVTGERVLRSTAINPETYSADGRRFMSGRFGSCETGRIVTPDVVRLVDVSAFASGLAVMDLSPDGRWVMISSSYFYSGTGPPCVTVWETGTGRLLWMSKSSDYGATTSWFSPDGSHLLREFQLKSGRAAAPLRHAWVAAGETLQIGPPLAVKLPEGVPAVSQPHVAGKRPVFFVSGAYDVQWHTDDLLNWHLLGAPPFKVRTYLNAISVGVSRHWYLRSGVEQDGQISTQAWSPTLFRPQNADDGGWVTMALGVDRALISPDEKWALLSGEGKIAIFRLGETVPTHEWPATSRFHTSQPGGWSRDSRFAVFSRNNIDVTVFDMVTGTDVATLTSLSEDPVTEAAIGADNRSVVVLRYSGGLEIWDLEKIDRELSALGIPFQLPASGTVAPIPRGLAGPFKSAVLSPLFPAGQ